MKILIADDDLNFRTLITAVIAEGGHTPLPEENGRLAWERLEKEGADMAVLDVNMPEMDGFELLKRIRCSPRHKGLPVLMLTIRAFAEDQVSGYDTGADDYLTKPFDNEILLARITALARRTGLGT
ncbi:MAG: transcriptional regulator [Elusimicrobia bacterium]|nr:MAG: transcriptional regulator [Elusimicrobiota bacterium]KAF0154553.1 MAG: transcriptional regulator [Elusimicrobiota bacterium]